MSSTKKVMEATARALAEMSADTDFLSGLNKCCRGIKRRLKWVVAYGGRGRRVMERELNKIETNVDQRFLRRV